MAVIERIGDSLVATAQAARRSKRLPMVLKLAWWAIVIKTLRVGPFRRYCPPITSRDGVRVVGGPADANLNGLLALGGTYEPDLTALVLDLVGPGDVCVDVGANVGYFTVLMARAAGSDGRVVAIEAEPSNLRKLRANLELNGVAEHVDVVGAAAAAEPGALTLHVSRRNDMLTRADLPSRSDAEYWVLHPWMKPSAWRTIEVPADTLAALVGARAASTSMLKVDVEGLEATVLRGVLDHFTHPDLCIVVELRPGSIGELADELECGGFRAYDLVNTYAWMIDEVPPAAPEPISWADLRGLDRQVDVVFTRRPLDQRTHRTEAALVEHGPHEQAAHA